MEKRSCADARRWTVSERSKVLARRCLGTLGALSLAALLAVPATAQTVVASDLRVPMQITSAGRGALLVCEAGFGPNTGRLSRVDTFTGEVFPLIDGLPSGIDSAGGPAGPTQIVRMSETRWYLLIGEGDVVRNTEMPGVQAPNAEGMSSPILSSILELEWNGPARDARETFVLDLADHFTLAHGHAIRRSAGGESIRISLVEDFRDFVPDEITNVRAANTFGMARRGNTLFVVDAGLNSLSKVHAGTGRTRRLLGFAPLPNPLPFGPPVLDAVPTSVRNLSPNQLLMTIFTGFPFPQGGASVMKLDLQTGEMTTAVGGLTAAIDVLPIPGSRGQQGYLVLEFSQDMLADPPAPGRLLHFASEESEGEALAPVLITPTSVAYEAATGRIFVSELATGNIVEVE